MAYRRAYLLSGRQDLDASEKPALPGDSFAFFLGLSEDQGVPPEQLPGITDRGPAREASYRLRVDTADFQMLSEQLGSYPGIRRSAQSVFALRALLPEPPTTADGLTLHFISGAVSGPSLDKAKLEVCALVESKLSAIADIVMRERIEKDLQSAQDALVNFHFCAPTDVAHEQLLHTLQSRMASPQIYEDCWLHKRLPSTLCIRREETVIGIRLHPARTLAQVLENIAPSKAWTRRSKRMALWASGVAAGFFLTWAAPYVIDSQGAENPSATEQMAGISSVLTPTVQAKLVVPPPQKQAKEASTTQGAKGENTKETVVFVDSALKQAATATKPPSRAHTKAAKAPTQLIQEQPTSKAPTLLTKEGSPSPKQQNLESTATNPVALASYKPEQATRIKKEITQPSSDLSRPHPAEDRSLPSETASISCDPWSVTLTGAALPSELAGNLLNTLETQLAGVAQEDCDSPRFLTIEIRRLYNTTGSHWEFPFVIQGRMQGKDLNKGFSNRQATATHGAEQIPQVISERVISSLKRMS